MDKTRRFDETYWRGFVQAACDEWSIPCDIAVGEPFGKEDIIEGSIFIKVTYTGTEEAFDGSKWLTLHAEIERQINDTHHEIDLSHKKREWLPESKWKQWVIYLPKFRERR